MRPAKTVRLAIRRCLRSARLIEPRRPGSLAVSSQRPQFPRERPAARPTAARRTRWPSASAKALLCRMGAPPKPWPASPANMSKQGLSTRLYVPNQTLITVKAELPKKILAAAKRRQVRALRESSADGTDPLGQNKAARLRLAERAALEPS